MPYLLFTAASRSSIFFFRARSSSSANWAYGLGIAATLIYYVLVVGVIGIIGLALSAY